MIRTLFLISALSMLLLVNLPLNAGDQDFVLINATGVEIHEVYISSHATDEWEEDVLGEDTFPEGEQLMVNFDHAEDECLWDIMVKDGEGNSIVWQKINLCRYSEITLQLKNGEAVAQCE